MVHRLARCDVLYPFLRIIRDFFKAILARRREFQQFSNKIVFVVFESLLSAPFLSDLLGYSLGRLSSLDYCITKFFWLNFFPRFLNLGYTDVWIKSDPCCN